MSAETKRKRAKRLIKDYGRFYSEDLGIPLEKGTPSPLFRWLCASLLYSARISQDLAAKAARRLAEEGWTTADKMAASTWKQRVTALNQSGYARYDESTSRMLGDVCERLTGEYGGDLRKLRARAEKDPAKERKLLKEFKGIGEVGADIFFREAQVVWRELAPFADKRALAAAKKLKLGDDARELQKLVGEKEYPRLAAALVRVDMEKAYDKL